MCVADAPELFQFNDDEVAEVIPGAAPQPDQVLIRVARGCPSGALQVYDGDKPVDAF
jgi:ferredoxin